MVPPLAANLQVLMGDRVVYDGEGIGQTSTQVTARVIADSSHRDWITVYWAGHNNIQLDLDPSQIKADIAAAVASLAPGNNRFVILSVMNNGKPEGIRGGRNYPLVLQVDADLAAMFPNNYLNVRSALIQRYDPSSAQDVQDFNNDVLPTSLRYDEIHLRQEGSLFVAGMVRDFILSKGW